MLLQTKFSRHKERLSVSDLILKDQYHSLDKTVVFSIEKMLYLINKNNLLTMITYLKKSHQWFNTKQLRQPSFFLYEDLYILCVMKLNQAKMCKKAVQDMFMLFKYRLKKECNLIKQRIRQLQQCNVDQLMEMIALDYDMILDLNNETIKLLANNISSGQMKVSYQRTADENITLVGVHNTERIRWMKKWAKNDQKSIKMSEKENTLIDNCFENIQKRLLKTLFNENRQKTRNFLSSLSKKKRSTKNTQQTLIIDDSSYESQSTTLNHCKNDNQYEPSLQIFTPSDAQQQQKELRDIMAFFYSTPILKESKTLNHRYYFNDIVNKSKQSFTLKQILTKSQELVSEEKVDPTRYEQITELRNMLVQISHQVHKWFINCSKSHTAKDGHLKHGVYQKFKNEPNKEDFWRELDEQDELEFYRIDDRTE